jgi:UDP-glucose 4-epimerase
MRVVVLGASGNVGTSVLKALKDEPRVDHVVGVSRRKPEATFVKTEWVEADISTSDLVPIFQGADAVVHLAWLIQPSRDEDLLQRVNVEGSRRVFDAVAEAGVKTLVHASSVGAYAPGPKKPVDEAWSLGGIPEHYYCRQKAEVERILDHFEALHDAVRIVRLRPAFCFKREAATGIRRLFMGPLFPSPLLRAGLIKVVPDISGLSFQAVHSDDVGEAYRLAIVTEALGAFNIAAEPVLNMKAIAELLGAWCVPTPRWLVTRGMKAAWFARMIPSPETWLEAGLKLPLMSTERAVRVLGWHPRHTAMQAVAELLEGLARSEGLDTPPLDPATTGPLRMREVWSGVGGSDR